jgi:hypothetical protein
LERISENIDEEASNESPAIPQIKNDLVLPFQKEMEKFKEKIESKKARGKSKERQKDNDKAPGKPEDNMEKAPNDENKEKGEKGVKEKKCIIF